MFLLVILLNFIDLWWFIAVAWICQEYCRIFLFWIFWYFEGFGWCKRRYGKIKALVEINRINKTLPPNLDSTLQYNFSNYYYNYSLTYFRNVTLQLVKLYCLKPSTLWRIGDFWLDPSQPIPNSQIMFIVIFIIFIFFFLWNVLPHFLSLSVYPLLQDKSRHVISFKSYPFVKWFHGAWTRICLSVFFVFFPFI